MKNGKFLTWKQYIKKLETIIQDNYRAIADISFISKIFSKGFKNRMEQEYIAMEAEQVRFRVGRFTMDHMLSRLLKN